MKIEEIKEIADAIGSPHILVAGDLILDSYVWGEVERISPEAPIQVFEVTREEKRLGGAGNVIQNLTSLGAKVTCVGVIGKDAEGEELKGLLENLPVDLGGLMVSEDRPTTQKTRLIAQNNQQVLRVDEESKKRITSGLQKKVARFVKSNLDSFDFIIVSDYNKGLLTDSFLAELFQEAKVKDIPTLVDPKGSDYQRYRGTTSITPNRREAEVATGIKYNSRDNLAAMGRWLLENLDLEYVFITLGAEGIYLQYKDGREHLCPARVRSVYDVTGAGDTVIAALGLLLASHLSCEQAMRFANSAAAVVVEKLGAASVTIKEILEKEVGLLNNAKCPSLNQLENLVKAAKLAEKKIVFTNGCFDILHRGHIEYLRYAKNLGDLLILGVNSDRSIREIKGKNRPFCSQDDRISLLSALEMVDYVIVFDETSPQKLIELISPDILVKGEDYREKVVVGREIVEARGGKVEFAPLVEGLSTTKIARKISESFSQENPAERWSWEENSPQ